MLLSMHVHFLIITNIHISGIFLKLVSQCTSVRMTQFFYILTYNIHVKVYCYCLTLNCYCLDIELILSRHWTNIVQRLLSNHCCLNSYCPRVVVQPLLFELLLSNHYCLNYCCPTVVVWTVVVRRLLSNRCCLNTNQIFLIISRVLELRFKWDWSRWKAKTRGYKFSAGRRTQFCLQDSQTCSSTHQSYYPTESVTTQSRLVTHNWSSKSPN
jgi:hypothetical protein